MAIDENFIPVVLNDGEKYYLSTVPYNSTFTGLRFKIQSQIHTARLYDINAANSIPIRIKTNNKTYALGTMPDGIISAACNGSSDSDKNKTYIFQLKKKQLNLLTTLPFHVRRLGYIPNFHLYMLLYEVHGSGGHGLNVWTSLNYGQQFSFDGIHWISDSDSCNASYIIFGKERMWLLGTRYNSIKKTTQYVIYECKDDTFTEVQVVVSDSDGYLFGKGSSLNLVGFDFNLNFYAKGVDYQYSTGARDYYIYRPTSTSNGSFYLGLSQKLGFLTEGQNATLDMAKKSLYRFRDITNNQGSAAAGISFTTTLSKETYVLKAQDSYDKLNITGNGINQTVSVSPKGAQWITIANVFNDSYITGVGD